jgi:hypothetical protein
MIGCRFTFRDFKHDLNMFIEANVFGNPTYFLTFWQAGKGGELTHDETTIISGALELTEKTASQAMTPIDMVFSLDVNAKLDLYVF